MNTQTIIILALIIGFMGFKVYSNAKTKALIQNLENPQLIDVRTPAEFEAGHHPDSVNIPLSDFSVQMSSIDKKRPVVIVCRSGNRSAQAKKILEKSGYTNVHNGGAWTNL